MITSHIAISFVMAEKIKKQEMYFQRYYSALHHANKVAKTNADKAQLFAESVVRHFGIESNHFDSNHFDEVNKLIEDNHRYFILLWTQMATVLTLEMNMSLWPILTPKPSLR